MEVHVNDRLGEARERSRPRAPPSRASASSEARAARRPSGSASRPGASSDEPRRSRREVRRAGTPSPCSRRSRAPRRRVGDRLVHVPAAAAEERGARPCSRSHSPSRRTRSPASPPPRSDCWPCVGRRRPVRVVAERPVRGRLARPLEPDRLVLAGLGIGRPQQRRDPEAAGPPPPGAARSAPTRGRRAAARRGRRPPRTLWPRCAASPASYRGTAPPDPALVERMIAALVHRGPDEGGVDAFGRCVLGHRRLKVIDLETGYQPVDERAGRRRLRLQRRALQLPGAARGAGRAGPPDPRHRRHARHPAPLRGARDRRFVERLHGMFALALWDASRERLVLARDRLGKKPLLYAELPDGTLAFASELKALLRLPGLARELDLDALDAYLALQYVPGPATRAARGRRSCRPATCSSGRTARSRSSAYWTLEPRPAERDATRSGSSACATTVGAAVRRRLVADVPLGALLSGGIDSSIVVALMAQASAEPVRTFTVGFADARYDEREYARAVAERYGTRHEEVVVEPDRGRAAAAARLGLRRAARRRGGAAALLVSRARARARDRRAGRRRRRRGVRGLRALRAHGLAAALARVPVAAAARRARAAGAPAGAHGAALAGRSAPPACSRSRRRGAGRALRAADGGLPARAARRGSGRTRRGPTLYELPAPAGERDRRAPAARRRDVPPGRPALKADLASMAHSLELRSPFLDHEVLELGLSLPDRLKLKGPHGQGRAAAGVRGRAAARGRRPRQDRLRRPARPLVPRGPARARRATSCSTARARDAASSGPRRSKRLLAEHAAGRADHGHRLWCLLMLELWQRIYVESEAPPASALDTRVESLAATERARARAYVARRGRLRVCRASLVARGRARRDPRALHGEERRLRAHVRRERHVRLRPGRAVGVDAAALRLLPRPALLGLRAALARGRARADRARGRDGAARLRDRATVASPRRGHRGRASLATLHPYLVWHDVHVNREILDGLLAAAVVLLRCSPPSAARWPLRRRARAPSLGLAILGNSRLVLLPLVLVGYLAWRLGSARTS